MTKLTGKKIMILVANGVDEAVMSVTQREMIKTGGDIKTVAIESGIVNSWNAQTNAFGLYFPADQQLSQTLGSDFDFLIVPDGDRSTQKLSSNPHTERIITAFVQSAKKMAFIGGAAVLLDKTGHAAIKDSPLVLTGQMSDVTGFIQSIIAHFSTEENLKAAA